MPTNTNETAGYVYRWENPGDGSQFDVHESYGNSTDAKYSRTGIAFNAGYNFVPKKNLPSLDEVWVKFDYYNGRVFRDVQVYLNGDKSIGLVGTNDATFFNFFGHEFPGVEGINTVLMHISKITNTAELWINGTKVISGISANLTAPITSVSMSSSGWSGRYTPLTDNWMSNIIVSNKEIGLDENVKIAVPQSVTAHYDTRIATYSAETEHADVDRVVTIKATEIPVLDHYDTHLESMLEEVGRADISRLTYSMETERADISRRVTHGTEIHVTFHADTCMATYSMETERADISRRVTHGTEIHVTFHADTFRATKKYIRQHYDIQAEMYSRNQFRYTTHNDMNVRKGNAVVHHYDVSRNKLLEIKPFKEGYQDVQEISINLNELTLSDSIKLTTTSSLYLTEIVRGKLLDYDFQYAIESTSQRGLQTEAQLMMDCDALLYQQIIYNEEETKTPTYAYDDSDMTGLTVKEKQLALEAYEKDVLKQKSKWKQARKERSWAQNNMERISRSLDKKLVFLADNFMSSNDWLGTGNTFSSIISALWGWTNRVPRRQVNVFMRGDNLYVLQRGMELQTIDITNSAHTVPEIDREIVRTAWTRTKKQDDDSSSAKSDSSDGGGIEDYFSGSKTNGGMTYEYADGLLMQAQGTDSKSNFVWILYTYTQAGTYGDDAVVMTSKTEHMASPATGKATLRQTYYSYAAGWCTATEYEDGEFVNSSEYQQSPVSRVTEFQPFMSATGNSGGNWGNAALMVDRTFPVRSDDVVMLQKLTNELQWMNRKTKETIKMDIYHYDHLIDFTDRLKFNGNEYYMVSNDVAQTQTELKQTVTMVRWY